jgi:hypothetical protein
MPTIKRNQGNVFQPPFPVIPVAQMIARVTISNEERVIGTYWGVRR